MALSDDLRQRVVRAVVDGGLSRNAAAKRFGVSIASAVRWVARFKATGGISLVQLAGIAVPIASRPIAIICLVSFAVINGDVQLARRFDSFLLPRWMAGKEFEQLVLAIVRNLPLKEPSVLTVKGLRRILLTSEGVSARIFRMLNNVAVEAIETGAERVTDEALERYRPLGEDEAAFQ